MEHRAGVEKFEVGLEASSPALQRAEQEHTSGVVEQQIVLDVSDVLGGLPHETRVWYRDTRDGLRCHGPSVGRVAVRGPQCPYEPYFPQKATYDGSRDPPSVPSCSWCSTG